jgi:transposase
MAMKKQSLSPESKQEAVRLLEQKDAHAAQLARELGVKRNQLYKWQNEIRTHGKNAFPGKGQRPKPIDQTKALKAKIKQLELENEILKKAAVYFTENAE